MVAGWAPAGLARGRGRGAGTRPRTLDLALAAMAGAMLVTVLLWGLDLGGVRWTRASVFGALLFPVALSVAWALRRQSFTRPRLDPWLLPHAAALPAFALTTLLEWNVHADFIYHWGQKASHNHLLGAVDFEFLGRPWNTHLHPDYPNMMPTLGAAASLAHGEIAWWPAGWLAILWFAVLALALTALAAAASASPLGRFAAAGAGIWTAAAFAIGYRQAGGADLPLAAAVAAAAALLLTEPAQGRNLQKLDWQVALVAAFAAATKLEGMPLAALILAAHLARTAGPPGEVLSAQSLRRMARRLPVLAAPTAVMAGYWLATVIHHDLFVASNTSGFDWRRLPDVLLGLWNVLRLSIWHGTSLAFLALPLLLLSRRDRWAALLLAGQLAFYVYAYAAGPVDTRHWIETSGARLLFHLLPSLLVLTVAALDRWSFASRIPAAVRG